MTRTEENAGILVEGLELAIFTGAPGKVEGEFAQWRKDHPRAVVVKVDTGSPIIKSGRLKGIHLTDSPPMRDSVLIAISVLYRESPPPVASMDPKIEALLADKEKFSIKKMSRGIEELLIRRALEKTKGSPLHAAQLLEISQRALLYKIKEYGITYTTR